MITVNDLTTALNNLNVTSTWSHEDSNNLSDTELQVVCDNASSPLILSDLKSEIVNVQNARPLQELRNARNFMLSQTDWWVLPDLTATQAQLDYRQALRDITNTYSSLDDVVWPVKPE